VVADRRQIGNLRRASRARPLSWGLAGNVTFSHCIANNLALAANTQRAFERGAFGIPTFFVGDEIFFGKDRLRDVEEEIERIAR